MNPEYEAWIKVNVSENPLGDCRAKAEMMVKTFPELRLVRGHYHCMIWGQRGHWWCETGDGKTVDPTAAQFPSGGLGVYKEFTGDESELSTGRCPNCGEPCYHEKNFCSDSCSSAYVAWIQKETR
jgi:hypothetical protein